MANRDATTTTRPQITNAGFDPVAMLRKAQRGAYPSAGKHSKDRDAEVAYWRMRCGLLPEPAGEGETPARADDTDLDVAFLALDAAGQRTIIRSYLTSQFEDDWRRGAWLCGLAGLPLPALDREAWLTRDDTLERFQRRARAQARGGRARATPAAPLFAEELPL